MCTWIICHVYIYIYTYIHVIAWTECNGEPWDGNEFALSARADHFVVRF